MAHSSPSTSPTASPTLGGPSTTLLTRIGSRKDSDNASIRTTSSVSGRDHGRKVRELFSRNRSRSSVAPSNDDGEWASASTNGADVSAGGSVSLRPSVRISPARKGSLLVAMNAADRRSRDEDGVDEATREALSAAAAGAGSVRGGSIKSGASALRRVSSKVFSNPFSSIQSSSSTSPRITSPLAYAPDASTFSSPRPSPHSPTLPPGAQRMSGTYGDFDPISAADTASFSEDGTEGSLQDALEGANEPPLLPSTPECDAPTEQPNQGSRVRTKEARPGKQHGGGFFPTSPNPPPNRSASPPVSPKSAATSPISPPSPSSPSSPRVAQSDPLRAAPPPLNVAAPAAASLRRPRIGPTKSAEMNVATDTASTSSPTTSGFPTRVSGWFQQALNSSTNLAQFAQHVNRKSEMPVQPSPKDTLPSPTDTDQISRHKKKGSKETADEKRHLVAPVTSAPGARSLGNFLDKAVNYLFDTDGHAYDMAKLGGDEIWVVGGRRFDGKWAWEEAETEEVLADWDAGSLSDMGSAASAGMNGTGGSGGSGDKGKLKKRRTRGHLFNKRGSGGSASSANSRRSVDILRASPTPSPEPSTSRLIPATQEVLYRSIPATISHGYPPPFYVAFTSLVGLTYRSGFPPIPCSSDRTKNPSFGGMLSSIGNLSMSIGRGSKGKADVRRSPSPGAGKIGSSSAVGELEDGLTTDAGWGCMLRTGQSLLANALFQVHLGRDWHRPLNSILDPTHADGVVDATYARILTWFLDSPDPLYPFSVHKFAAKGKELGKEIGEWFGPSTAAGAIKSLTNDFVPAGLGVVSDIDGTVYKTEVVAASSIARLLPGSGSGPNRQRQHTDVREWQRPVLVLVNLRLGIAGVHPTYYPSIKSVFTIPQFVGISGGRPSSSYFFFGYQGNSLFYIDPHHPRPALPAEDMPTNLQVVALRSPVSKPKQDSDWEQISTDTESVEVADHPHVTTRRRRRNSSKPQSSAPSMSAKSTERDGLDDYFSKTYSDSDLRTFHTERVRRMAISAMDPSMLLGFLVKNEAEWNDLCHRIKAVGAFPANPTLQQPTGDDRPSDDSDMGVGSWSEPEDWDDEREDADSFSEKPRSGSERWPSEEPETTSTSLDHKMTMGVEDESWDDTGGGSLNPTTAESRNSFSLIRSDTVRPRPGDAAQDMVFVVGSQSASSSAPTEDSGVFVKPPSGIAPNGGQQQVSPARIRHEGILPPLPAHLHRPKTLVPSTSTRSMSCGVSSSTKPNYKMIKPSPSFPSQTSQVRSTSMSSTLSSMSSSSSSSSSQPNSPSRSAPPPSSHRYVWDETPRSRNVSAATVRANRVSVASVTSGGHGGGGEEDQLADSEETLNHGERRRIDSQGSSGKRTLVV